MTKTTHIAIDLDVHQAIEQRRSDFDQTPNDILRIVFGLPPHPPPTLGAEPIRRRGNRRRTGRYAFTLLGKRVEAGSQTEAYLSCIAQFADLDKHFLPRLAQRATQARRLIARNPQDLYIRSQELYRDHATPLAINGETWWIDTNLGRSACEKRIETMCEVAGLQFGKDLVLEFD